jgi:hypothetical protein
VDDPNLEYAQRSTDFVLERLQAQTDKNSTDQSLLDKLGWTAEDLQTFLERWRALKRSARNDDSQRDGRNRDLERALRSLGLTPRGSTLSGGTRTQDDIRGLEEGIRSEPPPGYRDAYRAFKQSISRPAQPGRGN